MIVAARSLPRKQAPPNSFSSPMEVKSAPIMSVSKEMNWFERGGESSPVNESFRLRRKTKVSSLVLQEQYGPGERRKRIGKFSEKVDQRRGAHQYKMNDHQHACCTVRIATVLPLGDREDARTRSTSGAFDSGEYNRLNRAPRTCVRVCCSEQAGRYFCAE